MQIEQAIFKDAPHKISGQLRKLFEQAPLTTAEPLLLHPQPTDQRRQFINRAICDGRQVFAQLLPITRAGKLVNIHATIQPLSKDRFILKTHNLSYVVHFAQINYIASL